jgi:hypothetical protein
MQKTELKTSSQHHDYKTNSFRGSHANTKLYKPQLIHINYAKYM